MVRLVGEEAKLAGPSTLWVPSPCSLLHVVSLSGVRAQDPGQLQEATLGTFPLLYSPLLSFLSFPFFHPPIRVNTSGRVNLLYRLKYSLLKCKPGEKVLGSLTVAMGQWNKPQLHCSLVSNRAGVFLLICLLSVVLFSLEFEFRRGYERGMNNSHSSNKSLRGK